MNIIDPRFSFHDPNDAASQLVIKHEQEITQQFLDDCKADRLATANKPCGETHKIASIPVAVYERWMREGFNPAKVKPAEVLARLRKEHLDGFITTEKRF